MKTKFYLVILLIVIMLSNICFADVNEDLLQASQRDDLAGVKKALVNGANVNARDFRQPGYTSLMLASLNGNFEIVKLLVQAGANVNAKNTDGNNALIFAVERMHPDIVKLLLINHANVNSENKEGWTALMLVSGCAMPGSGNFEIAGLLISNGAKVNAKNNNLDTPLIIAVSFGKLKILKFLIEKGADVNAKNKKGKTALDIAMELTSPNKSEIIRLLKAAGARSGIGN